MSENPADEVSTSHWFARGGDSNSDALLAAAAHFIPVAFALQPQYYLETTREWGGVLGVCSDAAADVPAGMPCHLSGWCGWRTASKGVAFARRSQARGFPTHTNIKNGKGRYAMNEEKQCWTG